MDVKNMPKVYRSMVEDGGKPKVGGEGKLLGVRVVPNPQPDIAVDSGDHVHPGTGGMSVAPDWRVLPLHLIPKRLHPRGRGSSSLVCWSLGMGDFRDEVFNADLALRLDPVAPNEHGFVEPTRMMSITGYQSALAATRDEWVRDEN